MKYVQLIVLSPIIHTNIYIPWLFHFIILLLYFFFLPCVSLSAFVLSLFLLISTISLLLFLFLAFTLVPVTSLPKTFIHIMYINIHPFCAFLGAFQHKTNKKKKTVFLYCYFWWKLCVLFIILYIFTKLL